MADITNYKTLQAYVDATLAEDGSSRKRKLEQTIAAEGRALATPSKPRKKKAVPAEEPRSLATAIGRESRAVKKKQTSQKGPR